MESIWKKTTHKPQLNNSLDKETADAVIIGGGLSGILTAVFLKHNGLDVVVLEADEIASGQTGNTTAKVTSQHNLIYHKLIETAGIDKALQYARTNENAISNYRKFIESYHIDCDWKEEPAFIYTNKEPENLRLEAEAARQLGIDASFVTETQLPFSVTGAVRFENQAMFHPLKFIYGILDDLPVYEHTKVLNVDGNVVETPNGKITAENIIFTTHYPFINRPGYFFMRMHQERSYAIAVEGAQKLNGMYLGVDEDGLSFRNFENLLIIGGENHRTGENPQGGQYANLFNRSKQFWPDMNQVAKWSAQDCMTLDGIPYIGRFSESTPNWYVATGFNKWGMTSSMASAEIISDLILDKNQDKYEVFSPQRFSMSASSKNFIKDGIHASKDLLRLLFKNPSKEIDELPTGHGGVVDYEGEKAGVYKDDQGEIHIVSVRCPHLGCQLEWNPEEKSWDCPCHGSRFDYHGKVIDNPAQDDLI